MRTLIIMQKEQENRLNTEEKSNKTNSIADILSNILVDKTLSDQEVGRKIRELCCNKFESKVSDENTVNGQNDSEKIKNIQNAGNPSEINQNQENLLRPVDLHNRNQKKLSEYFSIDDFFDNPFEFKKTNNINNPYHKLSPNLENQFVDNATNNLFLSFDQRINHMNKQFNSLWNHLNQMDSRFDEIKKESSDDKNNKFQYKKAKHFSSSTININGVTKTKSISRIEEEKDGKISIYKKVVTGDDKNIVTQEYFPDGSTRSRNDPVKQKITN